MTRSGGILALALVLAFLAPSCARKGRVIPAKKLSMIYADMFLADQWVRDNGREMQIKSDTALFYDAVFKKYGYDRKDFMASLNHYVENPEKFDKILRDASEILKAGQEFYAELSQIEEAARKANERFTHYVRPDFSDDSLAWVGIENVFWLPWQRTDSLQCATDSLTVPADSLSEKADSLVHAVDSLVNEDPKPENVVRRKARSIKQIPVNLKIKEKQNKDVEREDCVWTDQEQEIG